METYTKEEIRELAENAHAFWKEQDRLELEAKTDPYLEKLRADAKDSSKPGIRQR